MEHIRNFSIIAHIDHGKSTLADRLLQLTETVSDREMKEQLLDSMDLERERGITIKMQAVRVSYKANDGKEYMLNLIDTPGHVGFSYEVSRSLAATEGVLLLVDATQGIEAQTMANYYLALENDLEIIPVINKIDLPSADVEKVSEEIERVLGIPPEDCVRCSAKTGEGVKDILEKIVHKIPAPKPDPEQELKALIFDAHYDQYRGVVSYIRVVSGEIQLKQKIKMMASGNTFEILDLGFFRPQMTKAKSLKSGEVGYLISNIKEIGEAKIGDTITDAKHGAKAALPGYQDAKPMVFCGFYPVDTEDFIGLQEALEKLKLNDAALQYETESSQALGFGFRIGFLGLLHMDIVRERIEREFEIELVVTAPNVRYRLTYTSGEEVMIENPNDYPDVQMIESCHEPYMGLSVILPNDYLGTVMELVKDHRGVYKNTEYLDAQRQLITVSIPLNELISNFFDKLKSRTKGYASMDYWFEDFQPSKLVKVNILINGDPVDALSFISHDSKARHIAKGMAEKLKKLIPRQMYEVAIQGAIGGKVICRETISALRKNVTAKCYGGDISRKRKLLEKQKKGKKKMKSIGSVQVPKEAFLSVLNRQRYVEFPVSVQIACRIQEAHVTPKALIDNFFSNSKHGASRFFLDNKQSTYHATDWSFLGEHPLLTIYDKKHSLVELDNKAFGTDHAMFALNPSEGGAGQPFRCTDIINHSLSALSIAQHKSLLSEHGTEVPPFLGGWVAGMAYEWMCEHAQLLPIHQTEQDAVGAFFSFYTQIWAIHHNTNTVLRIELDRQAAITYFSNVLQLDTLEPAVMDMPSKDGGTAQATHDQSPTSANKQVSNFSKTDYVAAVQRVKGHIKEGDIYQANLTQRFSRRLSAPFSNLHSKVRASAEMPYGAYIENAMLRIVSTSPEQFLSIRGRQVTTQPIKGTIQADPNHDRDHEFKNELLASQKNNAELVMITDLERNDLGKICEFGSVVVDKLVSVESFGYLHHLVSKISGKLKDNVSMMDAVLSMMPGGSITGAPKKRAVGILSEIETVPRRWYTGAIGYLGLNGSCELNVAIRTLYQDQADMSSHRVHFHGGGGIVADSVPELEWEEALLKASNFMEIFG